MPPRFSLRLLRRSVMPFSRSVIRSLCTPSTLLSGTHPDIVRLAYKHMTSIQTTEYHFGLVPLNFIKMDSPLRKFFTLVFWASLNSLGLWFSFPSNDMASFHSDHITHSISVQISTVSFFPTDIWCVFKVFIFWAVTCSLCSRKKSVEIHK